MNTINGCPKCKSENLKRNNPNKNRTLKPKKRKNKTINPNSIFLQIDSKEKLVSFLKENSNAYNQFILQKIEESKIKDDQIKKNDHHIIPKHIGGLDKKWNMVKLSTHDHQKAHELRYEVYKDKGDCYAVRFWSDFPKNTLEAQQQRAKLSH